MKIDKRMIAKLLDLDDAQLAFLIEKLSREAGIDLSVLNLSTDNIAEIRRTLENADEGMLKAVEIEMNRRRGNGNGK